jgi:hypothetical protein
LRRLGAGSCVEIPVKLVRGLRTGALCKVNEKVAGGLHLADQRREVTRIYTMRYFTVIG